MRKVRVLLPLAVIVVMLATFIGPLAAAAEPQESYGAPRCVQWYRIKYGDTLYRIAVRFGTTTYRLAALNGIRNPDHIIAGRTICVRTGYVPPPRRCNFWYVVRYGDTLGNIGWRYGWSAAYLAWINGIHNPDKIYPGQRIWIPCHGDP